MTPTQPASKELGLQYGSYMGNPYGAYMGPIWAPYRAYIGSLSHSCKSDGVYIGTNDIPVIKVDSTVPARSGQWWQNNIGPTLFCPLTHHWSKYTFLNNWFDSTRVQNREVRILTHNRWIPRSPRLGGGRSTYSATLTGSYRCTFA